MRNPAAKEQAWFGARWPGPGRGATRAVGPGQGRPGRCCSYRGSRWGTDTRCRLRWLPMARAWWTHAASKSRQGRPGPVSRGRLKRGGLNRDQSSRCRLPCGRLNRSRLNKSRRNSSNGSPSARTSAGRSRRSRSKSRHGHWSSAANSNWNPPRPGCATPTAQPAGAIARCWTSDSRPRRSTASARRCRCSRRCGWRRSRTCAPVTTRGCPIATCSAARCGCTARTSPERASTWIWAG